MFSINDQKNNARQLLSLTLAAAMLTSIFIGTSYSRTSSRSSGVVEKNWATALTQPQTPVLKANGKIAFVTYRDGNAEIYTMNPDATNQIRLTNNSADDDSPAWSPDGTKIAFMSRRDGFDKEVYVMNADGSNQTRLTFNASGIFLYPSYLPNVAWSPDGAKIAFAGFRASGVQISVINADGSNLTSLTNHPSYNIEPTWSPDGTKIAFASDRDGSIYSFKIYVMNADGSNAIKLTNIGPETNPAWSPDGTMIAFTRFQGTVADIFLGGGIYVMDADGSNQRRLSSGITPAWSPDGTKIAFSTSDFFSVLVNHGGLYVMNADGSNQVGLTSSAADGGPTWQPLPVTLPTNPIDDAQFFVHQQYRDFLNREPDAPGLAHWVDEIASCNDQSRQQPGESLASCVERKRASTSAALFLSPEFQNTGSFVLRVYWGTLGKLPSSQCGLPGGLLGQCRPLYNDYLADMSQVAQGIVVNDKLAPDIINANKHAFVDSFVNRTEFKAIYDSLSNQQFVDKLFTTTGIAPTDAERTTLITGLNSGTETRSSVVFKVVDGTQTGADGALIFNTRYGQAFYAQEFDAAFVFMEYVGYLRRNPDQAGYEYWLAKLKLYGNWADAQMVLAFIQSPEYRLRFAQP